MDNVIRFPTKVAEEELIVEDPVMDFVNEALIPWAIDNYVDIDSMLFKLNAAAIMTCLQGMLLSNDI